MSTAQGRSQEISWRRRPSLPEQPVGNQPGDIASLSRRSGTNVRDGYAIARASSVASD